MQKVEQYNAKVIGAFITYENWQDMIVAQEANQKLKLQLFGKKLKMQTANEPSNYIWENLGLSLTRRSICFVLAITLMSIVIFSAYFIQF